MTGDSILEQARVAFGEKTALTLLAADLQAMLNQAVQELYTWLPVSEITQSIDTDTVNISNGIGAVPDVWDKILEVSDTVGPYTRVDQSVIANIDRLGPFFEPETPVWFFDGERIFVRPSISVVTVTHTEPPAAITNFALEVEQIPRNFHPALVYLVAALMYAQEEDLEQAGHYRGVAQAEVAARLPREETQGVPA